MKNNIDYLNKLRHSCAHLLAAAVIKLWPKAQNAIGPAIEDGFYQDLDMGGVAISEKDLPKIEREMHKILSSWHDFSKQTVTAEEAKKEFHWNKYKREMVDDIVKRGEKVTLHTSGDFVDLCRGGHAEDPKNQIKHFKLLKVAGAYWKGDEKKQMLTRIYGTCFPTKKELEEHLWRLEESKKRDHRRLGRDLDLFLISDQVGAGLPIFTKKGTTLRNLVVEYITNLKKMHGYDFVWTPHIAKSQIYHTSGHWGKYDAMFAPMTIEDEEYVLKPMNCPHHFQIYLARPRSYKELPMRIAENGTVYRHEKSGEIAGLLRVRALTIDDTHTFIRHDQTFDELNRVLSLIGEILSTFGFSDYAARISTHDPKTPDKYLGGVKEWDRAESALKGSAKHAGFNYAIGEGEAAFYGPKIDIMVRDSLGREWQLSTVQLDYNQAHNFKMTYVDEHGKDTYPAILHIAMIGSLERFLAILIEHWGGAFPLWLSPIQAAVLPISDKHVDFARSIFSELVNQGIRTSLDLDNRTLQAKIRDATLQKLPYMCIIGNKEIQKSDGKSQKFDDKFVSVRTREGKDLGMMSLSEFIKVLKDQIEKKI